MTDLSQKLTAMCDLLGVSLKDAIAALNDASVDPVNKRTVPTVNEHLALVEDSCSPGNLRGFRPSWRLLAEHYGDTPLDQITESQLKTLMNTLSTPRYAMRRSFRGGIEARRHAVHAWRFFWRDPVLEGLVVRSPAEGLTAPAKRPTDRRALSRKEVQQLFDSVGQHSEDPEVDLLAIRVFLETGARRGGLLGAEFTDLNPVRQTLKLTEKGNKRREQPVTRQLYESLVRHNQERAGGTGKLLHFRNGKDLTSRRLDTVWSRVKENPPFPDCDWVSSHVLRHTAGTWIERVSSSAVAAHFLGHSPTKAGVTGVYVSAVDHEALSAWAVVWNEETHPLLSED